MIKLYRIFSNVFSETLMLKISWDGETRKKSRYGSKISKTTSTLEGLSNTEVNEKKLFSRTGCEHEYYDLGFWAH